MKDVITDILQQARRAPSVLNSQPWRFRVCGNTIELYLNKIPELEPVDPHGRLQLASCGTFISHLSHAIREKGWMQKTSYFPRFEEENLVAFIKLKGPGDLTDTEQAPTSQKRCIEKIQQDITRIARQKDTELTVQNDDENLRFEKYFRSNCAKKLDTEYFRNSLNLLLRSESDSDTIYEDEVILSDSFFNNSFTAGSGSGIPEELKHRYFILYTRTDTRYNWLRSGEVLGNMMIHLRQCEDAGMMALPVISTDCCRKWIREQINLPGHPQFVLKMHPVKPREHMQKRPLQELIKQGF